MRLSTDRLTVEIAEPGVFPANTSRFDWTGFVTSIKLDGVYEFCTCEPTNLVHPSTGGVGLCNEYLCPQLCDAVKPGEKFEKFGIGLFTKPDQEGYCFYRKYEIQPFPMNWKSDRDSVTFVTEPNQSAKNSIRQEKKIRVSGQDLEMQVKIENTGTNTLKMEEFCHNFLTLDGLKIGPDYRLDIPYIREEKVMEAGTLYGKAGQFSFRAYNEKAALLQIKKEEVNRQAQLYAWTLSHEKSPVYIRCTDEFCPAHVDIWSIDHIISVETFYSIELRPGDSVSWKRRWHFGKKGENYQKDI